MFCGAGRPHEGSKAATVVTTELTETAARALIVDRATRAAARPVASAAVRAAESAKRVEAKAALRATNRALMMKAAAGAGRQKG